MDHQADPVGGVTILVIFSPPLAADYLKVKEPRALELMTVMSISVFSALFEHIGVDAFRKELQFRREFLFCVVPKLASSCKPLKNYKPPE